ncbi:MAG: DNA polymerase, partial [Candidatus Poribacteria bacterium]|nr:DNA polymerase [Candidatus Poribacteria bacterium]
MTFSIKDYTIGWNSQALPAKYLAVDTETYMINKDDPADIPQLVVLSAFGRHPDNPTGQGMIVAATDVESWIEAHINRIWIFHNAAFDFFVLMNHLKSEAWNRRLMEKVEKYEIRDSMVLKGLFDLATQGIAAKGGYQSLEGVISDLQLSEFIGLDKTKDEKYRLNYASIDGEDLNLIFEEDKNWIEYPIRDAKATLMAYQTLGRKIYERFDIEADLADKWGILTEKIQVASAIALGQIHQHGMAVDMDRAQTIIRGLKAQIVNQTVDLNQQISKISAQPFEAQKRDKAGKAVTTESGSPSFHVKAIFQLVNDDLQSKYAETYQPPRTATGNLQTAEEAWRKYADHPVLSTYFAIKQKIKLQGLVKGVEGQSRIHPKYGYLTKTGRTSCSGPNIQQVPKEGVIRECYRASEGHILIACDYAQLELATLAQTCIRL